MKYSLTTAAALLLAGVMSIGVAQAAPTNLVTNGSFEDPIVGTPQNWNIYVGADVPGWSVEWMDPTPMEGKPADANIELHRGVNGWLPQDGEQYAELDSDWDGPGGRINNEPASTRVYQDIQTQAGCTYDLSFQFSPRPNTSAEDNVLGVTWGGADVDELSAAGGSQTAWTEHTYTVTATGPTMRLAFEDRGTSNSLGTFLDNVVLEKVSCPQPPHSDITVSNHSFAFVHNTTSSGANTGGNSAGGSTGGNGGAGGSITNRGDDVRDSSTGNGGAGGNAGSGGVVQTGNATSAASTVNVIGSSITRINGCACGLSGDVTVRNSSFSGVHNATAAGANTGINSSSESRGGNAGAGGNISNGPGEGSSVSTSSTGRGGSGGTGGPGGLVLTGHASALSNTMNIVGRNVTRIR